MSHFRASSHVTVDAGPHPRSSSPVCVAWSAADTPGRLAYGLESVPVQRDSDTLVFIPLPLDAGQQAAYTPTDGTADEIVRLEDTGTKIRVRLGDDDFTEYHYADASARPYFWPVLAPDGIAVTRAFPMATVAGERHDHPHHRSIYVAHGEVNGADNWSEEKGHGYTRHLSVDEVVSGPVFGRFTTTSEWTDAQHKRILTQRLTVTVWAGDSNCRLMDVDLRLSTADEDVLFGDTKEGGLLSVRVATSLDVDRKQGGRITNAYGGIDEAETWGKAAHWCDYSGMVDGQSVGIAVMDHPLSFRYPTYWHVRNYGLMAANPFGLAAYTNGEKEGSYRLPAGGTLRCLYRVVVHRGDAKAADVRAHYLNFVAPPRAEAA